MTQKTRPLHTEILQHRIEFYLRGENSPDKLDESSEGQIEKLIKDGFREGELCVMSEDGEKDYRGWWSIAKC